MLNVTMDVAVDYYFSTNVRCHKIIHSACLEERVRLTSVPTQ
jgi:hypothetical protein